MELGLCRPMHGDIDEDNDENPLALLADVLKGQLKSIKREKLIKRLKKTERKYPFEGHKMKVRDEYIILSSAIEKCAERGEFSMDLVALKALTFPEIAFSSICPKKKDSFLSDPLVVINHVPVDILFDVPPFPVRKGDITRFRFVKKDDGYSFQVTYNGEASLWFPVPTCEGATYLALRMTDDDIIDLAGMCPFFCSGNVQPLLDFIYEQRPKNECIICRDHRRRRSILLPCCHVFCDECSAKFHPATCPVCKVTIEMEKQLREFSDTCVFEKCGCTKMEVVALPCFCFLGCTEAAKDYNLPTCPYCCREVSGLMKIFAE